LRGGDRNSQLQSIWTLCFELCKNGGTIFTIYTSYDIFLRKEVTFESDGKAAVHLGVKFPKPNFGSVNGHFNPNSLNMKTCVSSKLAHDSKQILHSYKYHHTLRGGSNIHTMNPR